MKTVAVVVLALACSPAFAQVVTPDPCAAWALDGYRPNMSREAALAVRPTTPMTYLSFEVREPGTFSGAIFFDNQGRLESYSSVMEGSTTAAELIAALRARLGEPAFVDSPVKTFSGTGRATGWRSESCEAEVSVMEERVTDGEIGSDGTRVFVGIGRQKAPSAELSASR